MRPIPWRFVAAAIVAFGSVVVLVAGARETPAGATSGTGLRDAVIAKPEPGSARARDTFRIGTFNIHGGRGVGKDSSRDLDRTARAIRSAGLDIVALQEVHGSAPDGSRDQAEHLGRSLRAGHLFAATERRWWRDSFGNGLLSGLPVGGWERIPLPGGGLGSGHRNVLVAEAVWGSLPVRIAVTHLDRRDVHDEQLRRVIDLFLGLEPPAVLLGDLNARPDHPRIRDLLSRPGVDDPLGRLTGARAGFDWIFTRGLDGVAAGRIDEGASDHPLVWAELRASPSVAGGRD